ncbi:glycosyltransferase [Synechococcus sp. CS-1328]|uniref:glycosyltransferase n=1 Tax=Synechococcus sp. CS-1328 TaxID=2847976 RepID=UPI00223ACACE|nr:glycosyltransferase [Synechococcus sp. CS-1328]MCT0224891.1 glycosyltransferase [Synechococcus sp. CS-1328]
MADELDQELNSPTNNNFSDLQDNGGRHVFLSLSNGQTRAFTSHDKAQTVREACTRLITRHQSKNQNKSTLWRWARIDVIASAKTMRWGELKHLIRNTKRNYFEYGIAFDEAMTSPVTESELLGWSLLYSSEDPMSFPRESLLRQFSKNRFGNSFGWPTDDQAKVVLFKTIGGFCDHQFTHRLAVEGPYRGYRELTNWTADHTLLNLISRSTNYLSQQVSEEGQYCYGRWPCFDRHIRTYNTLRHFSSTYALLEGWELTQEPHHLNQARRALDWGLTRYSMFLDASKADSSASTCFLRDINNEIKLGGTAHVALALSKYQELTGDNRYNATILAFARGIGHLQDLAEHGFVHVLEADSLEVKDVHRIIYYDGEALFALVRAYEATGEREFLDRALRAADDFIADEHWKAHDHWLAYGFSALFHYSPRREFLQFGLDNIRGYLNFIKTRITTYPTLLELCTATQRLIAQAEGMPDLEDLLNAFDLNSFNQAMAHRARYLVNGFFWPETAMFFRKPESVANSFFIRHHGFRTRIDDNEHYISGLCAYYKLRRQPQRSIWLLNRSIPPAPGGIEFAAMQRAGLLRNETGDSVSLLTLEYDPGLHQRIRQLQRIGRLSSSISVFNLFDWIQDAESADSDSDQYKSAVLSDVLRQETSQLCVEGSSHERWISMNGQSSLYWTKGEHRNGYDYINYFHAGLKWRRETYAAAGWLSRTQLLCPETGASIQDVYHRPGDASIALTVLHQQVEGDHVVQQVLVHDLQGRVIAMHADMSPLIAQWLRHLITKTMSDTSGSNGDHFSKVSTPVLICDRITDYDSACRQLRQDPQFKQHKLHLIGCLHSHHRRPDGRGRLGNEHKHYIEWLSDDQTPYDALVCLTQRQDNDIYPAITTIPCTVIPHPMSKIADPDSDVWERQRKIVYIARYSLEKNHEAAFRIAAAVCREVSDVSFHFYGGGQRLRQLQSWLDREGLSERISLESHLDTPSLMYQESCLSMSTSHYEGFSLGILESLSCGCPVVAFDVEYGPREMIQPGVNGMLIQPGDMETFTQTLITLLRDHDVLSRLQNGARTHRDHLLTPAQVQARWRRLFNSLDHATDQSFPPGITPEALGKGA